MRSLGTHPASSALSSRCFFGAHTNGGLLLHRPLLVSTVSCSLDPFSHSDGSHACSHSRLYPTLSNRYADYGSCGRNPTCCYCHGRFTAEALTACTNFAGNRNLRRVDFLTFNGYGGLYRDCSYDGQGSCSRDSTILCNSYSSEKNLYREASLMLSRHGHSQREFLAADKSYGNPERSFKEPLFQSDGNISKESLPDLHSSMSHGSLGKSSPFQNATVSVFWDLDNKPPKSSPYHAALYLRKAASQFGSVIDMVAYANRHAFIHVPEWVREERRDRRQLDHLERRGQVQPEKPYVCRLCGRKCKTNLLLKKHFKELHEREHNKRMSRLNSLKGKKREKFKESVQSKTVRYKEAARPILVPKVGYGLESDLRRAGVYVRTVQYKPQAADIALKRQMSESINKGVKCLCLVSDDTDFAQMLADARALNLRTIVFGESKSLKRFADLWLPWDDISQGIPIQGLQEAFSAWRQHHSSLEEQNQNMLASGVTVVSDVEHRIFAGSSPMRRTSFSMFSEDEQSLEHDADVDESSSDDDAEFAFDAEDELNDDWEDDFDEGFVAEV